MPLPSFDVMFAYLDQLQPRMRVVAAGGADVTVLEAMSLASQRGWIEPVLTGPAPKIEELAHAAGISLDQFRIVDVIDAPSDSSAPAQAATAEIRAGRADLLMKGQIATPALMKAVLDRSQGLRTDQVICQVVLMELLAVDRRFLMTDTGITITPNREQKRQMLNHLASAARGLLKFDSHKAQSKEPIRMGLMAATEKVSEAMPDTLDCPELCEMGQQGAFSDCVIEGPLSFDMAMDAQANSRKQLDRQIVGNADAMLFPSLQAANLTVKAIMYTAHCRFGGMLMGTTHPVVFMSRADETSTRLNSLALAISYALTQRRT
ncbi:Phosphate butyryltransferase [Planctopirus limnophila DSM 3776]|uniref:Phosphate butyryltransferase n=1 Tax=Planctopirus limnophila (strain ATCC 43296 / DSM 3776 / IFAM 1008 / Mu 290) TaxID=521674 RepID=D5SW46_PLAL2|nr:phosphate acyltransferase [Planctopirus limnophila]ADG67331.1 Phosphate butyryltransferase [Planctopirus limnophila DSM 3776]